MLIDNKQQLQYHTHRQQAMYSRTCS